MKIRVFKMVTGVEYIVMLQRKSERLKLLKIEMGQKQNGNGNEQSIN